jgi:hypothetical protein
MSILLENEPSQKSKVNENIEAIEARLNDTIGYLPLFLKSSRSTNRIIVFIFSVVSLFFGFNIWSVRDDYDKIKNDYAVFKLEQEKKIDVKLNLVENKAIIQAYIDKKGLPLNGSIIEACDYEIVNKKISSEDLDQSVECKAYFPIKNVGPVITDNLILTWYCSSPLVLFSVSADEVDFNNMGYQPTDYKLGPQMAFSFGVHFYINEMKEYPEVTKSKVKIYSGSDELFIAEFNIKLDSKKIKTLFDEIRNKKNRHTDSPKAKEEV